MALSSIPSFAYRCIRKCNSLGTRFPASISTSASTTALAPAPAWRPGPPRTPAPAAMAPWPPLPAATSTCCSVTVSTSRPRPHRSLLSVPLLGHSSSGRLSWQPCWARCIQTMHTFKGVWVASARNARLRFQGAQCMPESVVGLDDASPGLDVLQSTSCSPGMAAH